jgi:hypothetical protein
VTFDRGSFSMMNKGDFQVVCVGCGCLAIRIEDPVRAPREAIVYCGECGASRGTVGALRDLAVQPDATVASSTGPAGSCGNGLTADDQQFSSEISRRYGELQRLRQQVRIAESLARDRRLAAVDGRRRGNVTPAP